MPRVDVTELVGYRIAVVDVEIPVIDQEDGKVIHDAKGEPKLQTAKKVVLFDAFNDQVTFVLLDDTRRQFIQMLTGGIEIPDVPVVRHADIKH